MAKTDFRMMWLISKPLMHRGNTISLTCAVDRANTVQRDYCFQLSNNYKWATSWQNQQNGMCAQWRLKSAWVSAKSDQSLCCRHGESLGPSLPIERTAMTLIRLGRCPGWSESSLGTQSFCWFCHKAAQMVLLLLAANGAYTALS